MEPALEEGQHLLVNKLVYFSLDPQDLPRLLPFIDDDRDAPLFPFHPPNRGEVIIFHWPRDPSRDFVKRVIGTPGDTVEIRLGQVFVNGHEIDEPYVTYLDRRNEPPITVPPDSYFVLGDNRRHSSDSRDWGLVPADSIIGRAWVCYWPMNRIGIVRAFGWP